MLCIPFDLHHSVVSNKSSIRVGLKKKRCSNHLPTIIYAHTRALQGIFLVYSLCLNHYDLKVVRI